jgi:putative hydrolase of the HAD superfamily
MITTLLCDVDGVLAIGEPFSRRLAREHGLPPDTTAPFFQGRFLDCLVGKGDLREELAAHLPAWGWRRSVDDFLEYWFSSEHVINAPLVALIQGIRRQGLRCYLATNQERYRMAYLLERMGFAEQFDGAFSSAQIGCMKHEPAFFVQVLQQLGVSPQDVLFWDDSPGNVVTARAAGLHAERYCDVAAFTETMRQYLQQT